MKKSIILVAVATLFLLACQKENQNGKDNDKGFVLKASIETLDPPTSATINDDFKLVWSAGDTIGVFVDEPDWEYKNQPFILEGNGGSTIGDFTYLYGSFDKTTATVAYFPWQSDKHDNVNNFYDGDVYFNLPQGYTGYYSGKMLTPLVAPMHYNGSGYDDIAFKHAGAAIKVIVTNLPAGAHSMGVFVDGKQIRGNFHISTSDFGSGSLVPNDSEDTSKNDVWLNFEPTNAEGPFTFIFPVPPLTTPKLSFKIYDKNDVLVWEKNLKAQSRSLGRGDILSMPPISIIPYEKFTEIHPSWTIIGTANGDNWKKDIPLITNQDHTFGIAKGLVFEQNGAFKARAWKDFAQAYPGENYVVPSAGTYDIILEFPLGDNWPMRILAVPTGECPYPSTSGLCQGSNLDDPSIVTGTIF